MSDATLVAIIFVGFFIVGLIAATVIVFFLLPKGDRCPICDTPTIRVESKVWNTLLPWLRTSWCYECDWNGMLRHGVTMPVAHQRLEKGISAAGRPPTAT